MYRPRCDRWDRRGGFPHTGFEARGGLPREDLANRNHGPDKMARKSVNQISESGRSVRQDSSALFSPEWQLLVASASVDAGIDRDQTLREKPVDWETALRLADDHGVSALLYQNLSRSGDAAPSRVKEELRQRYEKNVHKSLFLTRELFRILDCIDALGIEAICYKGIVQSEVYYGDMALRHSGDIDLFVRARDVRRIKEAVRELGYTPRVEIPKDAEADYIATGYEYTFDSPLGKNLLELQWALQPRFYAVDFDMEGMFERAVKVNVAGRLVKTPSPEDLLLVLSIHAAKHVWGRLIWLCDIAQILKRERIDWESVRGLTRELGVQRILNITLLLLKSFLGTAVPESMKDAVLADQAAHELANGIAPAVAAGVSYGEQQGSYFRLMLRLRERRIDRWRFLARLTFTPGPGEWELVRLPRVFFPFYPLVRLGRLAARLSRGSRDSP